MFGIALAWLGIALALLGLETLRSASELKSKVRDALEKQGFDAISKGFAEQGDTVQRKG